MNSSDHNAKETGIISIVPTPIGNLDDITLRAINVLKDANVVFAEDTRVTGKLLSALGISKSLKRLDENSMGAHAKEAIELAREGKHIAYCSDAGMPGVSDPGMRLIAAARESGIGVDVLPGASAAVVAYVASGTASTRFYFGGFLSKKTDARKRELECAGALDCALVFYESPNRIVQTLEAIHELYPERQVAICRELTKLHQEIVRGVSGNVLENFKGRESVKGEIVIVIDAPDASERTADEAEIEEYARRLAMEGESTKSVTQALRDRFGISRNEAYGIAMDCSRGAKE